MFTRLIFKMCDLVCETQEAVVERCDVICGAAAWAHRSSLHNARRQARYSLTWARISAWRMRMFTGSGMPGNSWIRACIKGRLRPAGIFPGADPRKAADCQPGLLHHGGATGPGARAEAGLADTQGIVADCKSGVTGAGRKTTEHALPGTERELYR